MHTNRVAALEAERHGFARTSERLKSGRKLKILSLILLWQAWLRFPYFGGTSNLWSTEILRSVSIIVDENGWDR